MHRLATLCGRDCRLCLCPFAAVQTAQPGRAELGGLGSGSDRQLAALQLGPAHWDALVMGTPTPPRLYALHGHRRRDDANGCWQARRGP
jgi:hypothetical protein